jgi:hypothetical protein
MKGYNTSKFEKKEKSREKFPKRQDSAPTSKFPRAKKNATLHLNLRDQKHYNARTKELIAKSRMSAYESPYEQKISKIVRVENHHQNERERLFLYSITGDSANPHYISLSKAVALMTKRVASTLVSLRQQIDVAPRSSKIRNRQENL